VSATTRAPRPGEVNGREYTFLERATFEKWRECGEFVESFEVFGNCYGTPRRPLDEHLAAGDDILLELDVYGALTVKEQYPQAVLVFLLPPNREAQRERLLSRGSEADAELELRLGGAAAEEAMAARFDHVVVNDDLERAVGEVAGILATRRTESP
jgi:guanylate kinase